MPIGSSLTGDSMCQILGQAWRVSKSHSPSPFISSFIGQNFSFSLGEKNGILPTLNTVVGLEKMREQ